MSKGNLSLAPKRTLTPFVVVFLPIEKLFKEENWKEYNSRSFDKNFSHIALVQLKNIRLNLPGYQGGETERGDARVLPICAEGIRNIA
jgi:hypothetical protein